MPTRAGCQLLAGALEPHPVEAHQARIAAQAEQQRQRDLPGAQRTERMPNLAIAVVGELRRQRMQGHRQDGQADDYRQGATPTAGGRFGRGGGIRHEGNGIC